MTPVVPELPPPPSAEERQRPLPRRSAKAAPNRLAEAALKEARQLELQLKRSESSRDAAHERTQKIAADAARAYRRAIAADASNAEAHAGLARALGAMGQHQEAQAADAMAERLRSSDAEGALVVVELGEVDDASIPYGDPQPQGQTAPASSPLPTTLPAAPAVAAVAAKPPPVEDDAAPAVASESEAFRRLMTQGQQRARAGDVHGARSEFEAAVRMAPENVDAVMALGNTLAVLGHYDHAAFYWKRARELSDSPAVHRSVATNLERARQKQEALADPDQGPVAAAPAGQAPAAPAPAPVAPEASAAKQVRIEISYEVPPEAVAAYEEGIRLLQAGSPDQAVRVFGQAIRRAPHFAEARIARGTAYMTLGDYRRARKDYAQALRLAPSLSAPLYGLGEASLALGRERHARTYFMRYLASEAADVRPHLREQARLKVAQLH
ncbi:MAG TPA: tetratricopeptide repeat protein [Myxococcaceae bacterium]|nr:tetratricopeptide repeat protein [Myxococcaceae bacterium]